MDANRTVTLVLDTIPNLAIDLFQLGDPPALLALLAEARARSDDTGTGAEQLAELCALLAGIAPGEGMIHAVRPRKGTDTKVTHVASNWIIARAPAGAIRVRQLSGVERVRFKAALRALSRV